MWQIFSLRLNNNTSLYVVSQYVSQFHLPMDIWLASTSWLLWTIVNNIWTSMCRHVFENCFSSLGYIPRSRMTGSYGYFIFNFLRNCPIFHSDCTILLSHEELLKVQFLYTLTNTLFFFFVFLIVAILTGVRWYLIVVLVSTGLSFKGYLDSE